VVWVGYDDNRELSLNGADSALPLWTEFMKRATQLPPYRDAQPFTQPPGIVSAPVLTPEVSTDSSDQDKVRYEVFIQGTQSAGQGNPSLVPVPAPAEAALEVPPNNDGQLMGATLDSLPPPPATQPQQDNAAAPNPAQNTTLKPDTPTGELRIQTAPQGLEVLVDGKSVGSSPVSVLESVGDHALKIVPPAGGAAVERTVTIKPAELKTITIRY
jgi:membrane peptidoglycan carboxypeptidase